MNEVKSQSLSFRKDIASYNQDTCGICLEKYKVDDPIVELACKHLYHSNCLIAQIIRCPLCKTSIEGRDKTFSKSEIDKLVEGLFDKIALHLPDVSRFRGYSPQIANDLNESQNGPDRSVMNNSSSSLLLHLEKLLKSLDFFADRETYERNLPILLQQYNFFAIEAILKKFSDFPVTMKDYISFDQHEKNIINFLTIFIEEKSLFIDFIKRLNNKIKQDPRIINVFEERKKEFIKLNREYFQKANFFSKISSIEKYKPEQIELLSENIPEFRAACKFAPIIRYSKLGLPLVLLYVYKTLKSQMDNREL
jgi:hypothetical protein